MKLFASNRIFHSMSKSTLPISSLSSVPLKRKSNSLAKPIKQRQYSHHNLWLMKNEPPYSLNALSKLPTQIEPWVGVRNAEAKNIMLLDMKVGQFVFYYEANIPNPHISGIAEICSKPYPDPTAFDSKHKYYDPNHCDSSNPHWYLIDVKFVRFFQRPVYLAELKHYEELKDLIMLKKFRLSISPIDQKQWDFILELEQKEIKEEIKKKLKQQKTTKETDRENNNNDKNENNNNGNSKEDQNHDSETNVSSSKSKKRKKGV